MTRESGAALAALADRLEQLRADWNDAGPIERDRIDEEIQELLQEKAEIETPFGGPERMSHNAPSAPTESQRVGATRAAASQARDINEALSKGSASAAQKPTGAEFEQATEKLAENITDAYLMAVEGDADCEALCAQRLLVAETLFGENLERWLGKKCPKVNWATAQGILREGRAAKGGERAALATVPTVRVTAKDCGPTVRRKASQTVAVQVKSETIRIPVPILRETVSPFGPPSPDPLSDLASQINKAHAAAKAALSSALKHAIKCGELLSNVKKRVPHGQWLPFLRKHCPELSERSAQVYVQLFSCGDEIFKCAASADLSISAALAMITKPRRKRQVAAERTAPAPMLKSDAPAGDDGASVAGTMPAIIAGRIFDGAEAAAVCEALEAFFKSFSLVMHSFRKSATTRNDREAIYSIINAACDKLSFLRDDVPAPDEIERDDYKTQFCSVATDDPYPEFGTPSDTAKINRDGR
jgi:hypothetical protein